jgi:transcriptional regulator with XRE-family HTH domain
MKWAELRRKWNEDPEWVQAFEEEYPFRDVAMAIVSLRAQLGLTQAELARLANTHQSVIARLESGQQSVEIEFLNRIAAAVGQTWRPVFGQAEEQAAERAVERAEFRTREPIFVVQPQSSALFAPLDLIRITKSASFIPSPARSRVSYEVSRRPARRQDEEPARAGGVAA